jgi:hypothetical protein
MNKGKKKGRWEDVGRPLPTYGNGPERGALAQLVRGVAFSLWTLPEQLQDVNIQRTSAPLGNPAREAIYRHRSPG